MRFRMSDHFPSRVLDKVVIRVPDGMKARIKRAADANGRSVNAELVMLLDRTYPASAYIDECVKAIADMIARKPADQQNEAWRSVFERMEKLRE